MILIAKNWWSLALRGLLGVVLGIVTFVWPGITLSALVFLFGVYALLDGIFNLAGAWQRARQHERWGSFLFEGVVGVLAGLVTIVWPAITALALVAIIAAWAMVTGIFEIAAAIRLRKHITGEWLLALSGLASVIFGVLLLVAPITGALVIALWFGAYALVFGALLIALAFRLRSWAHRIVPPPLSRQASAG
jgi:uncharacterized membrane protein HdeD (DUF308 family)